jgi:hypothetical protein
MDQDSIALPIERSDRVVIVEITGPGGHSWGDFGLPNPVHALGRAISRLAGYPAAERTAHNVQRRTNRRWHER